MHARYSTLRQILRDDIAFQERDGDNFAEAATAFDDRICSENVTRTFETALYGDIKVRIGRAYMAAQTAFFHLSENPDSAGCISEEIHPFPIPAPSKCTVSEFVREEIEAGAKIGGNLYSLSAAAPYTFGSDETWSLSTETMLYRLFALSALAYNDRIGNGGKCFQNPTNLDENRPHTAYELCSDIYATFSASRSPDAPSSTADLGTYRSLPMWQTGTFLQEYSCGRGALRNSGVKRETTDSLVFPPPPPQYMYNTYLETEGKTTFASPKQDAIMFCAQSMEYGLLDVNRLFGLSDPHEPFVWYPRSGGGEPGWSGTPNFWNALASIQYNAIFEWKIRDEENDPNLKKPINRLKLYMGYRVGATGAWITLAFSVIGYFVAYASWPLLVMLSQRVLGMGSKTTGEEQTIVRPDSSPILILVFFFSIFAWIWIEFVDPSQLAPYTTTDVCTESMDKSGPGAYTTSWIRDDMFIVGRLVGLLAAVTLFFRWFLSPTSGSSFSNPRLLDSQSFQYLPAVSVASYISFLCTFVIYIFLFLNINNSGTEFVDLGPKNSEYEGAGYPWAKAVVADVEALMYMALFVSFAVGSIDTRWVIVTQKVGMQLFWIGAIGATLVIPVFTFVAVAETLAQEAKTASLVVQSADPDTAKNSGRATDRTVVLFLIAVIGVCVAFVFFMMRRVPGSGTSTTKVDVSNVRGLQRANDLAQKFADRARRFRYGARVADSSGPAADAPSLNLLPLVDGATGRWRPGVAVGIPAEQGVAADSETRGLYMPMLGMKR